MIAMHSCSETNEWVWIMGGRRTILEHSSKGRVSLTNIKLFESTAVLLCVCLYGSGGVEDWSDFNIYFKKL